MRNQLFSFDCVHSTLASLQSRRNPYGQRILRRVDRTFVYCHRGLVQQFR